MHGRIPVFSADALLTGRINESPANAVQMLATLEAPSLAHYPVSPRVKSARSEGLELIAPIGGRPAPGGAYLTAPPTYGKNPRHSFTTCPMSRPDSELGGIPCGCAGCAADGNDEPQGRPGAAAYRDFEGGR